MVIQYGGKEYQVVVVDKGILIPELHKLLRIHPLALAESKAVLESLAVA